MRCRYGLGDASPIGYLDSSWQKTRDAVKLRTGAIGHITTCYVHDCCWYEAHTIIRSRNDLRDGSRVIVGRRSWCGEDMNWNTWAVCSACFESDLVLLGWASGTTDILLLRDNEKMLFCKWGTSIAIAIDFNEISWHTDSSLQNLEKEISWTVYYFTNHTKQTLVKIAQF